MAKNLESNPPHPQAISVPIERIAQPSSDFYAIFSEAEVLGVINALEARREIPLKYAYKDRGGKIWDNFYLKYIIPTWYRPKNVEIDLLKESFKYINSRFTDFEQVNVIDVGAGNSYPVKDFIGKLHNLGKIQQYTALDISEELLKLSRQNFNKWFPNITFISDTLDIEDACISTDIHPENMMNIILHLGVTIGNHRYRNQVFKNFRDSMGKNDLLIFTNEIGANSSWNGTVRGGCDYHAEQLYEWIKSKLGICSEDCQLIRKYDAETDSVVANMQICQNYTINFNLLGLEKNIKIRAGEEVTFWRHHKHQIPELIQELEAAELKLVHYDTNKYSSHIMAVCQI
jgi:uncharacterized SAM-dependent methyltransferase